MCSDHYTHHLLKKANRALYCSLAAQYHTWYNTFLEGMDKESERYHSHYPEIQRRVYKEIRRIRFAQRRKI